MDEAESEATKANGYLRKLKKKAKKYSTERRK